MSEAEDVAVLTLFCESTQVQALRASLAPKGLDVQTSERRNLDGTAVESWLVLATVAVQSLPATLQALTSFLRRNKIESLQLGDLVINNPRPEDVEAALQKELHATKD